MKLIYKNIILCLKFGLYSTLAISQMIDYDYKREINGISEQWHSLPIPDSVFQHVASDLSDIRIYGIAKNDTIGAPYILKVSSEQQTQRSITFTKVNAVANAKGYYFTYEIPTDETINQIHLEFDESNFDYKVVLEGSHDQNEWFTVLNDYRILGIDNNQTKYTFTDLHFSPSNYHYYRLLIKSDKNPNLVSSEINLDEQSEADYTNFPVTFMNIVQQEKNSIIDIDMKRRLPLSYLKINVSDQIDYYRPVTIEYISDSVETEKGWQYQYSNLYSGTLTSLEKKGFTFASTLAQKLRITIQNHDNTALQIESAEAKGYVYSLVARFIEPAQYFLVYGNKNVQKPYYDIVQAATIIPENLIELNLGKVEGISKKKDVPANALFQNKFWLWGIMGMIIIILGWFTIKMLRKEDI
ncbi:DUF3999 family protein [Pseudozobellia sp. WGM2]|uniref:DUF3999 family protein n=1 Tax=Pseudozobellia sp. WGM2 TaxID=2787625 RepID=UPI001ADF75D1|nr:DUF3999 family protein [Pseudozobellia sp. WGM2]